MIEKYPYNKEILNLSELRQYIGCPLVYYNNEDSQNKPMSLIFMHTLLDVPPFNEERGIKHHVSVGKYCISLLKEYVEREELNKRTFIFTHPIKAEEEVWLDYHLNIRTLTEKEFNFYKGIILATKYGFKL